jgi:hypothetical protein
MPDDVILQDPLSDPGKAALYYNTSLPVGHPQREAVKAEVERYYQAAFPEKEPEVLDYQEPTPGQQQQSDNPDLEYWQASPVSHEFLAGIQGDLEAAAAEYGHTENLDTWVAFARANGQDTAAGALIELKAIAEQWPDGIWRGDAETKAQVYRLNAVVDRAKLAWATKHVGR